MLPITTTTVTIRQALQDIVKIQLVQNVDPPGKIKQQMFYTIP